MRPAKRAKKLTFNGAEIVADAEAAMDVARA
jgi:hypothetical protein